MLLDIYDKRYSDEKSAARKGFDILFQGSFLRPCKGLLYWMRWGIYEFDSREVRKLLNLPEESLEDACKNFEFRVKPIIKAVGRRKFKKIMSKGFNTNQFP